MLKVKNSEKTFAFNVDIFIDDIILQKLIDKKITLCIFILAEFLKKYPDYFKGKRLKSNGKY